MGTFLTTPKMAPALAARVEESVRGRRRTPGGAAFAPRVVSGLRLGLLAAVAVVIGSLLFLRHGDRENLERARAALLETVRAQGTSLTADEKGSVARAESWLVRFSAAYEGDVIATELRAPGALAAVLAHPALYVRGPLFAFTSAAGVAETAARSAKDPFLLCLIDPPPSRAERVLLGKVRAAYSSGPLVEEPTANVRPLHDAEAGLPFLLPPWAERVQAAPDPDRLARLRRDLERAPVERAKQAARASLLLLAMDEPGEGGGPTELDGERPHEVRIGIVDLASGRILLRMKKRVDPGWISAARRPEYASGLDGCALALDVREAVSGR